MDAALSIFFLILVVGTVVALAVGLGLLIQGSARRARERAEVFATWARAREWEYRPEDPSLTTRFTGAPFGRGSGQRATNVVIGTIAHRSFVAFEYRYTTHSGDGSTTHGHCVIALHLGVHAPDLAVGPTGTLRRWVDSLTGRDVAIGDPAFDRYFTVHSPSPDFARDVLLSDVRDVMRHHPRLAWRITGDSLLVVQPTPATPVVIDATIGAMAALVERIPPLVWSKLEGEAPR